jgi:predicted nuclease with TOPRIM domain
VAHHIQDLHLVGVLDELRDAYDLCKRDGHSELQSLLLRLRRKLLEALHESLNLYEENAKLHQQLSEVQAELRHLRSTVVRPTLTVEATSGHAKHKLS